MFADDEYPISPRPLWFLNDELLTSVLAAELNSISQLLASYPDIRSHIDAPDLAVPERIACFQVLAHRMIMDVIYETFAGQYRESPSFGDIEEKVLSKTQFLVPTDAPAWAVEMEKIVAQLPFHILRALPEPLRTQGYDANNAEQVATVKAAAETLGTVDQIQSLIARVLDEQLHRLEGRWLPTAVRVPEIVVQTQIVPSDAVSLKPKRRKLKRKRDRQRVGRDKEIAEIDEISATPEEFLRRMDERKVRPQPTWAGWPGSWVSAYKDPRFRALIHKDKSRALARVRTGRIG